MLSLLNYLAEWAICSVFIKEIGAFRAINIAKFFGMKLYTSLIIVSRIDSSAVTFNTITNVDMSKGIVTKAPVLITTANQAESHHDTN
jgi:hypothetical protein